MKRYSPRRASYKWTHDAPPYILDCFDSKTLGERYTIILAGRENCYHKTRAGTASGCDQFHNSYLQYFGACSTPTHPQGIGMWGEMSAYDVANYRYSNSHRRIAWRDLPEAVKACVRSACEHTESNPAPSV